MPTLAVGIRYHKNRICEALHIGCANWDKLLDKIERQELSSNADFADEQVWTFLLGCVYAMQGLQGISRLAGFLIETELLSTTKAWFEPLPFPPRFHERNTHLDLAFGSIALRNGTQSGIELAIGEPSWICFVEFKWYSDISGSVTNDKHRNQLARVIENGLYFHKGDRFAQQFHITLVTPEAFHSYPARSRLYQYKYPEYSQGEMKAENLADDLAASCLPLRSQSSNIFERIRNLHFHWISYEALVQRVPDSDLKKPFLEFASRFNGTKSDRLNV
jgi:hypothetical protein